MTQEDRTMSTILLSRGDSYCEVDKPDNMPYKELTKIFNEIMIKDRYCAENSNKNKGICHCKTETLISVGCNKIKDKQ